MSSSFFGLVVPSVGVTLYAFLSIVASLGFDLPVRILAATGCVFQISSACYYAERPSRWLHDVLLWAGADDPTWVIYSYGIDLALIIKVILVFVCIAHAMVWIEERKEKQRRLRREQATLHQD